MLIYVSLIYICLFLGYFVERKQNKIKPKVISKFIIFMLIFLISAMRYDVGTDYSGTYTDTYNRILNNIDVRMEAIPYFIYKCMALFKASNQWIFIITSFIITYYVCKTIFEQSSMKRLSLFIYICGTFYFFSFNGVRQAVAMAIFYYSLIYVKENRLFEYMRNTFIGSMFHFSEIIFMPMYFILRHRFSMIFKVTSLAILYTSSSYLMPFMFSLMSRTKYAMYVSHWKYQAMDGLNFSMILNLIILAMYEFLLWKSDKSTRKGKQERKSMDVIYGNIHYVGACVSMFATSLPLCLRLFINFRYIEFLSIPALIMNVPKRYKKIVTVMVYVIYTAYFVWNVGMKNGNEVLPYKTILNK